MHLSQLHTTMVEVLGATRVVATAAPEETVPSSRGHLLVVEDNQLNQMVAEGILEHLGYTAATSPTTAARPCGHALAAGTTPSSWTARCRRWTATRPPPSCAAARAAVRRTPVIAMTAGVSLEEQSRCSRVGMDGFVPKPISPDSLDAALGGYIPAARA